MRYDTSLLNHQKYFLLTVNQYQDRDISGVIYHELREDGIYYSGMIEMIRGVEDFINEIEYPAKCVERRSFLKNQVESDSRVVMNRVEKRLKETEFLVSYRIGLNHQFRGCWQGVAVNTKTGESTGFKSFLELMIMMESQMPLSLDCKLSLDLECGKHVVKIKNETFIVQLIFKKYKTWQGVLYWSSQKKKIKFRSYLEMILLMDEACSAVIVEDGDENFYENLIFS